MLTLNIGKFLVVSYDIEKTSESILNLLFNFDFLRLSYFKDVSVLTPTNISISFDRDRLIQHATITLPFIKELQQPNNIFKIVEVWYYDENNVGICLFRGLVKDIKVSMSAGQKVIEWELEDILSWLEYYTTFYYKGRVFLNIKDYLNELIERVKFFKNLGVIVDDTNLKMVFYDKYPIVSLDKTNAIENLQKYINQTAHKILYNPKRNVIEISSIIYTLANDEKKRVFELDETNIININYNTFSNWYVAVRVNTIKIGYSFFEEKLDDYESVVVYDPFVTSWEEIKSGKMEGRILDIWIEPQTSREAMINIAKERLLQLIKQQIVNVEIVPTKESFEMWLGDWVVIDGTKYFIQTITYNISPRDIRVSLSLKKFVTFELGQEIRDNWKLWDRKFMDVFWDGKVNEKEVFD